MSYLCLISLYAVCILIVPMLRLLFTGMRYFKLKILLADLFLLHACRAVYANSILCRNAVAEAMVWCIEAAESVEEIVDCIAESLSLLEVRKCVRNIVSCEKKYVKIYTENTQKHPCLACCNNNNNLLIMNKLRRWEWCCDSTPIWDHWSDLDPSR